MTNLLIEAGTRGKLGDCRRHCLRLVVTAWAFLFLAILSYETATCCMHACMQDLPRVLVCECLSLDMQVTSCLYLMICHEVRVCKRVLGVYFGSADISVLPRMQMLANSIVFGA